MPVTKILVVGAGGQIGSVLTQELRKQHGAKNVIASDLRASNKDTEPFEILNICDRERLTQLVDNHQITQIYHLAAILSAKGETNPLQTWNINMDGLFNVLEVAREKGLEKVFFPSSIAVFGLTTPRQNTPQHTILEPNTVYGMSKLAGENWCNYYHERYGLDVRSLRYPGVISYQSMPGGGTTDYAVEIYHEAVKGNDYECFLSENTRLPMIYMEDAIRATIELMEAPAENIRVRTSYNLASMSFTPLEVAAAIQQHMPDFKITYQPDYRQKIADSWSESINDKAARADWGWQPTFDLQTMTADMLMQLRKQYLQTMKTE